MLDDVSFKVAPGSRSPSSGARDRARRRSRCSSRASCRRPTAPCAWTASTSASSRSLPCGPPWATRSKTRFSSRRPLRATSASRSTTPIRPNRIAKIREAAREAQVLEETLSLPEASIPSSASAACSSRADRSNASPSRARSCGNRRSSSWMTLSRAVDSKTESAILEAIERQASQRTVVLVTHRIAAASRCDRVVVLDEGRVVEQGTHAELVARAGSTLRSRRSSRWRASSRRSTSPPAPAAEGPERRERSRQYEAPPRSRTARQRAAARPSARSGVPRGGRDRQGLRRAPPAAPLAVRPPHARYLVVSLVDARRHHVINLVRPLVMGDVVHQGRARRAPADARRAGPRGAPHRHAGAHVRSDVRDADRRGARDGRPAHVRLRLLPAPAPALLRSNAGRASRDSRDQRRRRRERALRLGRAQRDGGRHRPRRHRRDDARARLAPLDRRRSSPCPLSAPSSTTSASVRARRTETCARARRASTRS